VSKDGRPVPCVRVYLLCCVVWCIVRTLEPDDFYEKVKVEKVSSAVSEPSYYQASGEAQREPSKFESLYCEKTIIWKKKMSGVGIRFNYLNTT